MLDGNLLNATNNPPSLFKAHEDLTDPEFDNIFNEVISESTTFSKPSFLKAAKKAKTGVDKHIGGNAATTPKPSSHQGLLVTCTNEIVAARTVQLLHGDDKEHETKDMIVSAIGQPIVVAEELGEITAINLSSNGQWLALALSCFQIWIIQLCWKTVRQQQQSANSNTSASKQPKIISSVRHHATLEGHRARIHGLHFLAGNLNSNLYLVRFNL